MKEIIFTVLEQMCFFGFSLASRQMKYQPGSYHLMFFIIRTCDILMTIDNKLIFIYLKVSSSLTDSKWWFMSIYFDQIF
jgi:hypothetical protein